MTGACDSVNRKSKIENRKSAFTLIELLVVVAVIVVMMRLAVPAFNAINGSGNFGSEIYNIAGTLEQARAYAMANNTYVLAGIFEANGTQDSSASPQQSGTGRLAMAVVASKSGTRPYQTFINSGSWAAWPATSGTTFVAVTKVMVLPNIHLVDLQNSTSSPPQPSPSPAPNMARAVITNPNRFYNLANVSGTSSTVFAWPPGTVPNATNAQYTFTKVIEFDPQGSARMISTGNPASTNTDEIPQYLEIGLQPASGAFAAGPPRDQTTNAGQIAAIQINGISGSIHTYRP